jgi:hypothetical protein
MPKDIHEETDVTARERRGEGRLLSMRDVIDGQLESVDGWRIGRVADLRGEWRPDGRLVVTDFTFGPEALAGRVFRWAGRVAHRILGGRFEQRIAVGEAEELGPTVRLRGKRGDYPHTRLDDWLADHVVRWIPGGGP